MNGHALERLKKAEDTDGHELNMSIVGISTGVFVPCSYGNICKDWFSNADKVALEHAKTLNLPKKNMTAIYYERTGALIPDEKVDKCLEEGVEEVLLSLMQNALLPKKFRKNN